MIEFFVLVSKFFGAYPKIPSLEEDPILSSAMIFSLFHELFNRKKAFYSALLIDLILY